METLIALVSDPNAHVEDRALGMVYQLINQGFDEDSAIAQACACFNLYGLDAITICRAFDLHQKLDSLMEKSMTVQQLLQKLDHRTATRLHCQFINGHCFGDIPRPDSHEDDEFGGWLEEEWLIMTGLSAIASYRFAAERGRYDQAARHLPAISKSSKALSAYLVDKL